VPVISGAREIFSTGVKVKSQGVAELTGFYRAMHFNAKRGIAIACHLSVCPSVCPSVTLVDCDWNSSKIISPLVSLGYSLFATPT